MNTLNRLPYRGWNLLGDFDDIVNGLLTPTRQNTTDADRTLMPAMDIKESETGYEVRADLPGVDKDKLSVSVKDKLLTIEAETSNESVNDDDKNDSNGISVIKLERRTGKYLRTLKLGNAVDELKISAEYSDGVLKLVLPKATKAESRKIDVSVH